MYSVEDMTAILARVQMDGVQTPRTPADKSTCLVAVRTRLMVEEWRGKPVTSLGFPRGEAGQVATKQECFEMLCEECHFVRRWVAGRLLHGGLSLARHRPS